MGIVILIAAATSLTLPLGAWICYRFQIRKSALGAIAGLGSGALLAAAALDLLPTAVKSAGLIPALGVFLGGAAFFTILNASAAAKLAGRGSGRRNMPRETRLAIAIVAGAVMDGVPEAVALGIDFFEGQGASIALITAIAISNVPESMVGSAALKAGGQPFQTTGSAWAVVSLGITLFAGGGYLLASILTEISKGLMLALAAGGIVAMVTETLLPTGARLGEHRAGLAAAFGVTLIYVLGTVVS